MPAAVGLGCRLQQRSGGPDGSLEWESRVRSVSGWRSGDARDIGDAAEVPRCPQSVAVSSAPSATSAPRPPSRSGAPPRPAWPRARPPWSLRPSARPGPRRSLRRTGPSGPPRAGPPRHGARSRRRSASRPERLASATAVSWIGGRSKSYSTRFLIRTAISESRPSSISGTSHGRSRARSPWPHRRSRRAAGRWSQPSPATISRSSPRDPHLR